MLKWQAYISGALLTVIVTVSAYGQLTRAEHWTLKAAKHKPKTLTSERLKRTADLANIEKFKQELKPFMKVRVSGTTANVEVQEHIKSRMNSLGWYVEEDRFDATTPFEDKNFNNIIATYNPKARRKLTLACHFDSKYFAKGNFIGATDSAVPCAMLIHLADVLSNLLKKGSGDGAKDLSLQLIFFDGEEAFVRWTNEDSIYGARHLAEKLKNTPFPPDNTENTNELHRMDVLVLLDLIGAANPKFYSWFDNTRGLFDRLRKIETRLTKAELIPSHEAYFSDRPMYGNAGIEDDHIPFLRESVPVLHLICYPFPKVWHTVYDDESALDYQTISNLNKIMQVFVIEYLHLKS